VTDDLAPLGGRVLVVAFEGWNDAGEAASGALRLVLESGDFELLAELDSERYVDYQFNRPTVSLDADGVRRLNWPASRIYGPLHDTTAPRDTAVFDAGRELFLLLGVEPSRSWRGFASEVVDTALAHDVDCIVVLGAMLADVPHTRPISVFVSSDDAELREHLRAERSSYEGPVGILSVLVDAAAHAGIPSVSVWASVPHYVHNAPSPKAVLAILEALEELLEIDVPRGTLVEEAIAWESGIDALAAEDDDMAGYIHQLEQARDTVDSPDASGEAIAKEFERYLRRRGDHPDEPWRGRDS